MLDVVNPQVSTPNTNPVVPGTLTVVRDGGCSPGRTTKVLAVSVGMLISGMSSCRGSRWSSLSSEYIITSEKSSDQELDMGQKIVRNHPKLAK